MQIQSVSQLTLKEFLTNLQNLQSTDSYIEISYKVDGTEQNFVSFKLPFNEFLTWIQSQLTALDDKITALRTEMNTKVAELEEKIEKTDDGCVHLVGNETIDGIKTFKQVIEGTARKAMWA